VESIAEVITASTLTDVGGNRRQDSPQNVQHFASDYVQPLLRNVYPDWGKPIKLTSEIVRYNRALEALYGLSLYPSNGSSDSNAPTVQMFWRPRIHALDVVTTNKAGPCNGIPLSYVVSIRLSFEFWMEVTTIQGQDKSKKTLTPLHLSLLDPTPFTAGVVTYCQKTVSRFDHNTTWYPSNDIGIKIADYLTHTMFATLTTSLGQANWYTSCAVSLADSLDENNYETFKGATKSCTGQIGSGLVGLWTYNADLGIRAALEYFEQNNSKYRQRYWSAVLDNLHHSDTPLFQAAAQAEVALKILRFSVAEGFGNKAYTNDTVVAALQSPDSRLPDFWGFYETVMAAQQNATSLNEFQTAFRSKIDKESTRLKEGLIELLHANQENQIESIYADQAKHLLSQLGQ
jgi:hypothetical protein